MQTYRSKEFERAMNEHFDITDAETRKILFAVDEADQNQILHALTTKLYENILDKVDDIDYGQIPKTKGDITKLENYDKLVECIDLITKILKEYRQDTKSIDTVREALGNIEARKSLFEKAFKFNVELPMIVYSTMTLSIISSVSFMISSCIEFIKTPNEENFNISIDKVALVKTKQNLLFTDLEKFNNSCKSGQFDNAMDYVIKNNIKGLTGVEAGLVIGGIAIAGLLFQIIPIVRELTFFFYHSRVSIADYFEVQADLLQMNAANVENNSNKPKKDKNKIVSKQLKIADSFRKISNFIGISNKEAEVKTTKEITATTKKYKTSEVLDSVPDSATSSIF